MTIKAGDKVPSATFTQMKDGKPTPLTSDELFAGKTVALFALPGAFTPTCSAKHVPGFVQNYDAFKAKGVDTIACVSVNDAFVMGAWGKDQGAGDKVLMLADGNGDFTRAMGLEFDASKFGMGKRSQRYSDAGEKRRREVVERRGARGLRCFFAQSTCCHQGSLLPPDGARVFCALSTSRMLTYVRTLRATLLLRSQNPLRRVRG